MLLTLAILLVVGAIASNFVGKRLLGWGDAVVRRIPVVRSIYSSVKQVSDTLFSEQRQRLSQGGAGAVAARGVWTIAFVTGTPGGDVANHLRRRLPQRLRADHAEPDRRLFRDAARAATASN